MDFQGAPAVFVRSRYRWDSISKPAGMGDWTFDRILLQRAIVAFPRRWEETRSDYVRRVILECGLGIDPDNADAFWSGALYRPKPKAQWLD